MFMCIFDFEFDLLNYKLLLDHSVNVSQSHRRNSVVITQSRSLGGGGGEGVNHVKRDWLEIFNVNCDL